MPIMQFRMSDWAPDQHAPTMPPELWSDANDITWRDNRYERAGGSFDHYTSTPTPSFLLNFTGPDYDNIAQLDNFWLIGGLDTTSKVWLRENNSDIETEITLAGLAASDRPDDWTGGIINGFPVLTVDTAKDGLGASDIQYWDRTGTGTPTALQSLPNQRANYRVRSIAVHRNHIFGLSTISTANGHVPEEVIWSDAAPVGNVPQTWVPAAGNEAGDVRLGDTPGECVDAISFSNRLFIAKHGSIHSAEYIGGNAVFAFRKLSTEVGVIGRHCMVVVGSQMYLWTPYDIVRYDGVQWVSICNNRVKRTIFDAVYASTTHSWACFLTYNPAFNELWCVVPDANGDVGTDVFVYNIDADKWGKRDIAFAVNYTNGAGCAEYGWRFDEGVLGADFPRKAMHMGYTEDKRIVEFDRSTTDAAGGVPSWLLEREDLDFGDRNRIKIIKRVRPIVEYSGTTSIQLLIKVRNGLDEAYTTGVVTSDFDADTAQWIDIVASDVRDLSGKLVSFRWNDAIASVTRFHGFDVDFEWGGEW